MKKLYFIITVLAMTHQVQAQIVDIPDANFKNALINTTCVDTNGDGSYDSDADTNNDNEIQVSEAEAILRLNVSSQNIASLEGIEQFTNLELLHCSTNQLTQLDFSQNLVLEELYCDYNQLTTLDISKNLSLQTLNCLVNNLTNLDVSQNYNLIILYCGFNQLTALDVSQNSSLTTLYCYTNQLTSLNLKNGNNALLVSVFTQSNNNLTCIEVDDVDLSENAIGWLKDDTAGYSENCGLLGINDIENEIQVICYPNPVNNFLRVKTPNAVKINAIKVYDALGQLVMEEKIHFDWLDMSNLNKEIFLVIIETDNNHFVKKIVKK